MRQRHILHICIFFITMLAFCAFFSWRLDYLRTTVVLCTAPVSGQLPDESGVLTNYERIVPLSALSFDGIQWHVYLVEETDSVFDPIIARQVPVSVLTTSQTHAAVAGIYSDSDKVVCFSSHPLTKAVVTVEIWEEG